MHKPLLTILLVCIIFPVAFPQTVELTAPLAVLEFDQSFSLSEFQSEEQALELIDEIEKSARKKYHPDTAYWLEKVFYFIHRKYLKTYKEYASFSDLLSSGEYDCVTGTTLYAIVLERLGVPFKIIEYPYHTNLIVTLFDKEYMMEATDPQYGFVGKLDELQSRIKHYRISNQSNSFHKIIDAGKLEGLYYYNQAVRSYNTHSYYRASLMLKKANALYACERIQKLYYRLEVVAGEAFVQLSSY